MISTRDSARLALNSSAVERLLGLLRRATALRAQSQSALYANLATATQIAILFSGGLDCTVLACLIHDILPMEQSIDLLNVAFENPRVLRAAAAAGAPANSSPYESCPDRITALASHAEIVKLCPGRKWRLISVDVSYCEMVAHRAQIISLMQPSNTEMDFSVCDVPTRLVIELRSFEPGEGCLMSLEASKGYALVLCSQVKR